MMAASKAALLALALALGGCLSTPQPTPAPVVVAPIPAVYSCPQLARASTEFKTLPAGSMIGQMIDDYRVERSALKALHRLPDQTCPKVAP